MKIVLTTFGSRGDVQPMAALGAGLRVAGHEVLLAAPAECEFLAVDAGVEFRRLGGAFHRLARHGVATRAARGGTLESMRLFALALRLTAQHTAEGLLDLCRGADVLVGGGLQFLGPSVAEKLGIRYVHVALSPVSVPSAHHPPVTIAHWRSGRLRNRLAWRLTHAVANLGLLASLNDAREALDLPPIQHALQHIFADQDVLLAWSRHLVPAPPDLSSRARQVGFLLGTGTVDHAGSEVPYALHPNFTPPGDLVEFLDRGDPPVFVGFGSREVHDPIRLLRLVLEAAREVGVRVVLGGEWGPLGGEGARPDATAFIAGDVPHEWLFPRVSAVIHHGGAGTTAAGLAAGRPSLLIPRLGDQFYWGRVVSDLGLGPAPISFARLSAPRLAGGLRALLTTPDFATHAARLAPEIRSERGVAHTATIIEAPPPN